MWRSFISFRVVKFLASLKLAVTGLSAFALVMILGTLAESRYGAEYAALAIYRSWPFLIIQAMLFINILFAALVRLPFQKKLTGFYITHLGLLLLFLGAVLTKWYGLDGVIDLIPGEKKSIVSLEEPYLYASLNGKSDEPQKVAYRMPHVAHPQKNRRQPLFSLGTYDVYLKEYLPFARFREVWVASEQESLSLQFELSNEKMKTGGTLSSLDPQARQLQLGPLSFELMFEVAGDCLQKALQESETRYLLVTDKMCRGLPESEDQPQTVDGLTFVNDHTTHYRRIRVSDGSHLVEFCPEISVYPLNQKDSTWMMISLHRFRAGPHVIFTKGESLVAGKGHEWKNHEADLFEPVLLPWMDFQLTLERRMANQKNQRVWVAADPSDDRAEIGRAVLLRLVPKNVSEPEIEIWTDELSPQIIAVSEGQTLMLGLGRKLLGLPFSLTLQNFKMEHNPGTQDPASYESFVEVSHETKEDSVRIAMNQPLHRDGFTFYQSSYFPLDEGGFGSVLSVNQDPGRRVKYAGSGCIVFGSILHFIIRRRRVGES